MKLRSALLLALMIAGTARAELVMELSTPKTQYVQHEPFWVVLAFMNTGTEEEKLVRSFDPAYDEMIVYITRPDGKRSPYDSPVKAARVPVSDWTPMTVCLAPGEKFTAGLDLSRESRRDTLSRAGEYRIRVVYEMPGDDSITFESNECRLIVGEPRGVDRKVYDLLKAIPRYNRESLWSVEPESRELQQKTFQRILHRYPDSAYVPYVRLALAGHYSTLGYEWPDESQRPEWARRSGEQYRLAADTLADSPLGAEAYSWAVRNYRRGQDRAGCRKAFEAELACRGMTDEQRRWRLAFLYTDMQAWQVPVNDPKDVRVPLRPVAESMGFKVAWNPNEKTADVSNARVNITVRPEDMSEGRMMVPLKALAPLVADRYGRCRGTGSTIDKSGP